MSHPAPSEALCSAPCLVREPGFICPRLRCLIQAAREGDCVARESLFGRLRPAAFRQARGLCRRRADAEDLAHSSLLAALHALPQLRDCHRILPWLRRIVGNTHKMAHRSAAPLMLEYSDATEAASHFPRPDQLFLAEELRQRLSVRYHALLPTLRRVIDLRLLEELTTAEAALRLGISGEAVRTRLSRARRALLDP